jgi:hypothetical protein
MVLLLPPAPAARVLLGRADAVFSARSAAALRRCTTAAPPGGFGDWAVEAPVDTPAEGPEDGGGEDWMGVWVSTGNWLLLEHRPGRVGAATYHYRLG